MSLSDLGRISLPTIVGIFLGLAVVTWVQPETQEGMLRIVEKLKEREDIDGLILGGTELPLLLRQPVERGIPLLDTTRIHVARAVAEMFA